MSIMYNYLDKRSAAIAAIKDYDNMQFIIRNTDSEIVSEREKMVGTGSPNMDGMPHAHNPAAAEDRIVNGIDAVADLAEPLTSKMESFGNPQTAAKHIFKGLWNTVKGWF